MTYCRKWTDAPLPRGYRAAGLLLFLCTLSVQAGQVYELEGLAEPAEIIVAAGLTTIITVILLPFATLVMFVDITLARSRARIVVLVFALLFTPL